MSCFLIWARRALCLRAVAFALFFSLFLGFASGKSVAIEGEKLDDITLLELSEIISERMDMTVILSPIVRDQRRVQVFAFDNLSNDELYQVYLTVLSMHGYVAVEKDNIIKVVRERKARTMPVEVFGTSHRP